jgi:transglutaminase-like putative cysteine protease
MNENSLKQNSVNHPANCKAYITKQTKSVFGSSLSEIFVTFLTVLGTILCMSVVNSAQPLLLPGSVCGLLFALPFLYFTNMRKTEGRLLGKASVRLFLYAIVGLAAAFFFRFQMVGELGGIYLFFEDNIKTEQIPINAFFTGLILSFIFTHVIVYIQTILKSPSFIIVISFSMILQAVIFEYYTNSIPNIFGILLLVTSWVLQIVFSRSNTPSSFIYTLIVCGIAALVGIFSVFCLRMEPPYIIENGASFLRGEKKLLSVNIPYIPMRDIWKTKTNSMSMLVEEGAESLLYTDGKFEYEGIDVLEVTMDYDAYYGNAVYLRHFLGSNYNGMSWSELSEEQEETLSEVISGFNTENLSPQNLDTFSFNEINSSQPDQTADFEFYIKNLAIDTQKPFLPYFLTEDSGFFSGNETANVENEYFGSVTMPLGFYENEEILNDILTDTREVQNPGLRADEAAYRAFVYANYMDVPADFTELNPVLNDEYMEYITSETIQDGKSTLTDKLVFVRKINFIHTWLRNYCEYNIDVGEMPSGKDFALYFLNEKREGFCQHFATSATLLCRAAGIPARYVTGLIISPSDYENRSADGTVTVKDSRAHAWTEVYVNGYGWMPLDFTSGYSNVRTSLTAMQRQERNGAETEPSAPLPVTIEEPQSIEEPNSPETAVSQVIAPINIDTGETDVAKSKNTIIPIILIFITAVVLAFSGRILYKKHLITKRLQSNEGFELLLNRTKYILNASGLNSDRILTNSEGFIESLSDSCYKMVTPIIRKAISVKFGGDKITNDELKLLNEELNSAKIVFYGSQKPLKRFWLQYVLIVL